MIGKMIVIVVPRIEPPSVRTKFKFGKTNEVTTTSATTESLMTTKTILYIADYGLTTGLLE